MKKNSNITIRSGIKEDLPSAMKLIKELAEYEKALDAVSNSVAMMELDGFGANPIFGFFVAEDEHKNILGLSLYYFRYSTWKGKRLYLEDIIVTEKARGRGIGKLLFEKTLQKCCDENLTGITWQVLDWNESAINFYKKYNSRMDSEWVNCHLELGQIKEILKLC